MFDVSVFGCFPKNLGWYFEGMSYLKILLLYQNTVCMVKPSNHLNIKCDENFTTLHL